jgi:U3 small nucleolar ribonucleoprotein protein IMP3
MVRKLKHHESKLLRKVDFLTYKSLGGRLRQLSQLLANLDPADPYRRQQETVLLEKLWQIGILKQSREQGAGLSAVENDVTVSAFCRRRLGVLMVRMGMVENISTAHKFIEQGHVRVGTDVATDAAFLVGRGQEDFVTWVEGSKVERQVAKYREKLDDFDLL